MDNNKCQKIQQRLMAGEVLENAEQRHLRQCCECAAVARLCQMLSPEPAADAVPAGRNDFPSAALDARVRDACRQELRMMALRRRMRIAFQTLAAVAAVVVVMLGISLETGHRKEPLPAADAVPEAIAENQVSMEVVLDTSMMLTNDELDDFNAELAIALLSDDIGL